MAIRFSTNVPVKMTFPYGDYMDVKGQFGPQCMYTVAVNGDRDRLYATPALHKELQAADVGPGSELTVTKTEVEGGRKGWRVEPADHNGHDLADSPAAERLQAMAAGDPDPDDSIVKGTGSMKPEFFAYQALMKDSLEASFAAWCGLDQTGTFYKSEDVRAMGITLFIQCAQKGILPEVELDELPFWGLDQGPCVGPGSSAGQKGKRWTNAVYHFPDTLTESTWRGDISTNDFGNNRDRESYHATAWSSGDGAGGYSA